MFSKTIKIYHEYEGRIEKSVLRITIGITILIRQISTEIWFRTDKKCGRNGRTDARTTQKYIPLTDFVGG